ncbi:MAG: NUDIX domain-containing protein [Spirochaetales bacterium]|nr:NUDIX domain-containing protein [Spirochaetales bacterium]
MDRSFGAVVCRESAGRREFLLVLHARHDHWDIPKGHPEGDESPRETALREVLEETDYHVCLTEGFEEAIEYTLPWGGRKRVVYFLGRPERCGAGGIDRDEIKEVRWFSLEEARRKVCFENSLAVLIRADCFLG